VLPRYRYRGNVQLAVFQHAPLMVLAVGIGRYFYARAEMFKSADGAALAAVQEVDVRIYLDTGQIVVAVCIRSSARVCRVQLRLLANTPYIPARHRYPREPG
jgi:hypothetical protein